MPLMVVIMEVPGCLSQGGLWEECVCRIPLDNVLFTFRYMAGFVLPSRVAQFFLWYGKCRLNLGPNWGKVNEVDIFGL